MYKNQLIIIDILLIWFLVFINARTWMKSLHGRWFNLNEQTFDAIHYAAMAVYKILIMVFNLVPFIILSFLSFRIHGLLPWRLRSPSH